MPFSFFLILSLSKDAKAVLQPSLNFKLRHYLKAAPPLLPRLCPPPPPAVKGIFATLLIRDSRRYRQEQAAQHESPEK
jgi:hypothetical protein